MILQYLAFTYDGHVFVASSSKYIISLNFVIPAGSVILLLVRPKCINAETFFKSYISKPVIC